MPVLRVRAIRAESNILLARGNVRRYCCNGLVVASLIARLMVWIVTIPLFEVAVSSRPLLLGVRGGATRESASASSTARRQISRARRASPETEATFLLANVMASVVTILPGTPERRDWMIWESCWKL